MTTILEAQQRVASVRAVMEAAEDFVKQIEDYQDGNPARDPFLGELDVDLLVSAVVAWRSINNGVDVTHNDSPKGPTTYWAP